MAKFRGTIRHNDLEGGHYQLVADDGTSYQLAGSDDPILREEGAIVEIHGAIDRAGLSFAMTGPILEVKSVKRV